MSWSWVIHGTPIGKGRPRVFRNPKTGMAHGVTPARTRNWESMAAGILGASWVGAPLDVPVRLDVVAVFARPKRLMRKSDPPGRLRHPCRPDADNVAKAVMDAMQGAGVVRDDSQVCVLTVGKVYAGKDEGPKVEVRVSKLGTERGGE